MLTSAAAKRLPYSDHIVCIGPNGHLTAQGTFNSLNDAGGYVSSFSLPRADWSSVPDSDGDISRPDSIDKEHEVEGAAIVHPKGSDSGVSLTSSETACAPPEGGPDTGRRTGDVQIYLYYVKSVGWWATILFTLAIVGFVFCTSFPSKCWLRQEVLQVSSLAASR